MQKVKAGFIIVLALSVIGIASCKKKKTEDTTIYYWYNAFFAGNLTLNNEEIPIYSDASTNTQTANFFNKSDLLDGNIQEIGMKWYIPTDTALYTTTISNGTGELLASGNKINLVPELAFENNIIMDSVQYAVYSVKTTPPAGVANKETIENVKFMAEIDYKDATGEIQSRTITSDIYKKDQ